MHRSHSTNHRSYLVVDCSLSRLSIEHGTRMHLLICARMWHAHIPSCRVPFPGNLRSYSFCLGSCVIRYFSSSSLPTIFRCSRAFYSPASTLNTLSIGLAYAAVTPVPPTGLRWRENCASEQTAHRLLAGRLPACAFSVFFFLYSWEPGLGMLTWLSNCKACGDLVVFMTVE
jgi:hypothetical protein